MQNNLILDLDGTIFFSENRPGSLAIKGRRRDSFLARETQDALRYLQRIYNVILATGRSLPSVKCIADLLSEEGLYVKGIAAENGGIWVNGRGEAYYLVSNEWMEAVREAVSVMGSTAQGEFITCLALLSPQSEDVLKALNFFQKLNLEYTLLKDGNKLFVLSKHVNKFNALTHGIGKKQLSLSIGVGNDLNDVEWLKKVKFPSCPGCSKDEVKEIIINKGGFVTCKTGHDGILEVLNNFITCPIEKNTR